jgi:glucose 1-dehydrogenase
MNTVAIVTGSSQGIGQAIAARLAQDGVNVAIDYRTHAEGAEETLRQVEAAGARGVIVKADLSLLSVFFTTQRVVRHLQTEKRSGKIINISSVHEELPFPHFTSYCMSKGGLKMMTRNLAIELAPFGITINSVAPGAIETPINKSLLNNPAELSSLLDNIPLKRLGQPADVAEIVAFLASDKSNYITGTTIFVDGGLLWNYQEQ